MCPMLPWNPGDIVRLEHKKKQITIQRRSNYNYLHI